MIVADRKKVSEIRDMVKSHKRVLLVGCGTCVTVCLAGGEREGELMMEYDGERDPASAIEEERLVELLDLRKKAAQAEWAVFDILQELMRQHQKGIGVNLLHAETSVVRRTPRRVLASLLGSYHCFHQKKEGGAWYFDERKISQGVKKANRKYIIR